MQKSGRTSNFNQAPFSPADMHRVRARQGFFVGGGIPFVIGLLMLIRFNLSLPVLQPGEAHCGTGGLGGLCLVLFGSPLGAFLGAIAGYDLGRS